MNEEFNVGDQVRVLVDINLEPYIVGTLGIVTHIKKARVNTYVSVQMEGYPYILVFKDYELEKVKG